MYSCTNNTDNPLFDCSASDNNYYGWDSDELENPSFSLVIYFSSNFSSLNILVTLLISTSSNISTPASIRYVPILSQTFLQGPVIDVPDNLPEGSYQHNYTLSSDMMFDGVLITVHPNTTFQWVAINRIIFCPAVATTEG